MSVYAVTWLGGERIYSPMGGGTVHVTEGEVGAQNSPHMLQYIENFLHVFLLYNKKRFQR